MLVTVRVPADGAVCVIQAMKVGNPVFVMPLVFGPAQGFNALFTRVLQGFKHQPNAWFWVGLVGLIGCSVLVQGMKSSTGVDELEGGTWLIWTLMAAACWGMYGVASRMAVMHSAKASGGHGSHLRVLLGVSIVYAVFGLGVWIFGLAGLSTPITSAALSGSGSGVAFGLLTGLAGLGGAAFVIPANSVPENTITSNPATRKRSFVSGHSARAISRPFPNDSTLQASSALSSSAISISFQPLSRSVSTVETANQERSTNR